jgi:hypothetical protein
MSFCARSQKEIVMARLQQGPRSETNSRAPYCPEQYSIIKIDFDPQLGREQAARIGARLRAAGLASTTVYSSQWCRCLETARNLAVGLVVELPALKTIARASRSLLRGKRA